MLDNQLIKLFLPLLRAQLASTTYTSAPYNLPTILIQQSNQPTTQGTNSQPTIYFTKFPARKCGYPRRHDVWNGNTNTMDHTETQYYESMFQFDTFVAQNPASTSGITSSDLATIVTEIFSSDAFLAGLRAQDVNIERITDIRPDYFQNDYDRFTQVPSFDVIFTYKNVVVTGNNVIASATGGIHGI